VNARTKPPEDRRVQRTRTHLHAALMSMIRESPYEAITVSDILARANVGRSTFYMHFRNKDELLVSAMREFLDSARDVASGPQTRACGLTGFSLPLLEHIERHRQRTVTNHQSERWAAVHERLGTLVADMVAREVRRKAGSEPKRRGALAADLVGSHVASTFIVVLKWWLSSRDELRAGEVNELFQSLIPPAYA
jgi:AcrR family transcriptional regulator